MIVVLILLKLEHSMTDNWTVRWYITALIIGDTRQKNCECLSYGLLTILETVFTMIL